MSGRAWNPVSAAQMGVFYLDAVKPDWHRCINLRTLKLESEDHCVLGQCFTDYYEALSQLVPEFNGVDYDIPERHQNRRDFAERFGFQVPASRQEKGGYEQLGLAWKALIKQRRRTRKRR